MRELFKSLILCQKNQTNAVGYMPRYENVIPITVILSKLIASKWVPDRKRSIPISFNKEAAA